MKSIALHVPVSNNHAGFWTLFSGFFKVQPSRGITRDPAHPKGEEKKSKDDPVFFEKKDELEDYVRSFRD